MKPLPPSTTRFPDWVKVPSTTSVKTSTSLLEIQPVQIFTVYCILKLLTDYFYKFKCFISPSTNFFTRFQKGRQLRRLVSWSGPRPLLFFLRHGKNWRRPLRQIRGKKKPDPRHLYRRFLLQEFNHCRYLRYTVFLSCILIDSNIQICFFFHPKPNFHKFLKTHPRLLLLLRRTTCRRGHSLGLRPLLLLVLHLRCPRRLWWLRRLRRRFSPCRYLRYTEFLNCILIAFLNSNVLISTYKYLSKRFL